MRIERLAWVVMLPYIANFFVVDVVLVAGQCRNDQQSLIMLRSSLIYNVSQSVHLRSWNQSTDCCEWSGVDCDPDGHVIGLDLSSEAICGGIENSTGLFGLLHLQSLNLAFNKFNGGPIPLIFANLTNLTHLNLSNCGFEGQIPVEISRMRRLVVLDLSNEFGSTLLELENPNLEMLIQNLTELRQLYLDGVDLSAQGREWCQVLSFYLPKLEILSLSYCYLPGPIDLLGGLLSLSEIRLDGNNLSSPLPRFMANFTNLKVLSAGQSGLYGNFPEKILQMPSLEVLNLAGNELLRGALPEFPPDMSLQTLILSGANFSGKLPLSLGNLKNLSTMELTDCNFTGAIPTSVANLTQLVYLDLSMNKLGGNISSIDWKRLENLVQLQVGCNSLGGEIPDSLFALPRLEILRLNDNQFEGQLPHFPNAAFASALAIIDVGGNRLEGSIPILIFELKRLNLLVLSSNEFNGTIPLEAFGRLENLISLDLSYNRLTVNASSRETNFLPLLTILKLASCNLGVLPHLQNQSKLVHLDLSDNQIYGEIPNWIWNVGGGNLAGLNLSHNFFKGLQEPYRIPRLGFLDLSSNQLQGNIPHPPIAAFYIDLSCNNFTSTIPAEIGNKLSSTIFFSLSNNSLTGAIPDSICNATSLQALDLSCNNLSGRIPNCLMERGKRLGVLNLRGNNLNGVIPDTFSEHCELQTLDLNGNQLEGTMPKSLANCRLLEVLDLGNNQINDIFPCWLKNISRLHVIILRSNKFYGDISCAEYSLSGPSLQIVDLAFNNLTGKLPKKSLLFWEAMMEEECKKHSALNHFSLPSPLFKRQFYNNAVVITTKGREIKLVKILTIYTTLDLSSNNFQGEIPEEIGQLRSLHFLNFSRNAFTGSIPSSMGKLEQLESLDLSVNNLQGQIPTQLASLNFLAFLNLSNNHLEGRIPGGTQLQSFSPTSFEGNEELCGPPLKNCSDIANQITDSRGKVDLERRRFQWEMASVIGVGFGIGFAATVEPLIFSNRVDLWYDMFVNDILSCLRQ